MAIDPLDREKLLSAGELAQVCRRARAEGLRIVLCHGCFDGLHIGHVRHLRRARRLGDLLVVSVTADRYVLKGPDRPVFGEALRLEFLAALACVDWVALSEAPSAVEIIDVVRPHVFAKGEEYRAGAGEPHPNLAREVDAVRRHGGDIAFTDDPVVLSSRALLRPRAAERPLSDPSSEPVA